MWHAAVIATWQHMMLHAYARIFGDRSALMQPLDGEYALQMKNI